MNRHSTKLCNRASIVRLTAVACLFLPSVSRAQAPPNYTISTIAGTGATQGYSGDGGAATSADFNGPFDVVLDSSGNFYISDAGNFRVRKVAGGNISTIAGNGTEGTPPPARKGCMNLLPPGSDEMNEPASPKIPVSPC